MRMVLGSLGFLLLSACQPYSEAGSETQPTQTEEAPSATLAQGPESTCPFEFPTPEIRLQSETTPALLEFPVFSLDEHLDLQGADGNISQFRAWSVHPFQQDERLNLGAAIGYIQNMKGWKVLFLPEEVAPEFDRIEKNAIFTFEADTRIDIIEVDGIEIQTHFAVSQAAMEATLMLPINGGEVYHPVVIGVYPGMAGCDETMQATFDTIMANLSLNLSNPNYQNSEDIQEILAEKRKGL